MMLKNKLFIVLVLMVTFCFSQQQEYIVGKLLDAKTQEPIAFATIRIKDRALGMISNTDGSFQIPIKYREYGDIIEISSMGYQKKEVLIQDFSIYDLNNVRLQPALFELTEAIITAKKKKAKKLSAKKIVEKAITAIPNNYPIQAYSQVGYYRDYQLDKTEYVNLNEAILEVFDMGFTAIDSATSKVLLYDYRRNDTFKNDSLAAQPYDYKLNENKGGKIVDKAFLNSYAGNEFTILSIHNAIRNYKLNSFSFVYNLETDFLKGHSFSREEDTSIDNEDLYSIKIYKKTFDNRAFGRLLISKSDFSIYKMEYTVYDDTKKNTTGIKDKNGIKNREMFAVNTSYRKKDAKMFLNYISFHNNFTVKIPPVFKLTYLDFKMNYERMKLRRANLTVNEEVSDTYFELTFSDKLDTKYASNLKNYKAELEGERIQFDSISVIGKKVLLYPSIKSPIEQQMLKDMELLALEEKLNNEVLQIELKNLRDIHGNVINAWKTKDYDQFREFFVQQVKNNSESPIDGLFMKKDRPIFKDQPIVKPKNFDDYWMNSPLQTKVN
ncbi:MAG: carboxypeptidase-like regulatory domain-containing protein [Maribacter sp.]